jgi:hypothetical protein
MIKSGDGATARGVPDDAAMLECVLVAGTRNRLNLLIAADGLVPIKSG